MSFRDSSPFSELKVPLALSAAVALVVAIVAAAAILLGDRRETFREEAYGVTREVTDTVSAPVGTVVSTPVRWTGDVFAYIGGYFNAVNENRRLRQELAEAQQWRDVAIALQDANQRYKTLLGLKTDPPIPMVGARVVMESRGPFANTRVANAGKEKGVMIGNPVMSENGLIGRVIGVANGASRILLLTDVASRTPVMIDRTNARAILTGDGGPNPRLEFLRGRDPVKKGDLVLTSGDGGILPRGLPVGVAGVGLDGEWRVVLASDAAPVDFVRILLFRDFSQLADQDELNRTEAPPLASQPQTVGVITPPPPQPDPEPTPARPPQAAARTPSQPAPKAQRPPRPQPAPKRAPEAVAPPAETQPQPPPPDVSEVPF